MSGARILIADDEASFLDATTELLRREGYECDPVTSVDGVMAALRNKRYDVLVADIRMPGNLELRVVRESTRIAPGMPIILVTGYPSVESASRAVGLPVLAYMTKPVEHEELCQHIRKAVQSNPSHKILHRILDDLGKCAEELQALHGQVGAKAVDATSSGDQTVSSATVRRLANCVRELMRLPITESVSEKPSSLCTIIDCPHWPAHEASFQDVISVLQEIKKRFKSKQLAELRERLEEHLGIVPLAELRAAKRKATSRHTS